MLNEEKVKVMNRLALYEQGKGKKYLPISRYYRTDYVGLALIKNFFLVTIGYCLVLAGLAAYFGDYLMQNIHKMNLINLGLNIAIGYGIVIVAYTIFTYIQYTVKYLRAKKSVKEYYSILSKLNKIYEQEEKRSAGKMGGNRR